MSTADKCRAMGLKIGDTIEGREGGDEWWSIARLTLLWLGEDVVVWREQHISSVNNIWTLPKEDANWLLDYRDWRKVTEAIDCGLTLRRM
jgi:hypothetical protein